MIKMLKFHYNLFERQQKTSPVRSIRVYFIPPGFHAKLLAEMCVIFSGEKSYSVTMTLSISIKTTKIFSAFVRNYMSSFPVFVLTFGAELS